MDNQTKMELIKILSMFVIVIVLILIGFIAFFMYKYFIKKVGKDKTFTENKNEKSKNENKQSVFDFMEFDNIEDSMIIQKSGSRYLMIIGCQGINYDLMSNLEKNSVEEGFVQFLNTLRYPIQIYIQTRTINLGKSIEVYKEKVKEIENKYNNMEIRYNQMKESGNFSNEQLAKEYFELTKQSNLCEYGESVIQDTERLSLNKNILNKNYYIVIPYYSSETGNDKLDREEIKNIAFSELYTRAQSIINAISVCGVRGKILKSNELVELLYMAYNRDEAETFGIDKAIKAGYNELYSTAPDVYEKRMKELDKIIEERAMNKAKEKVIEAKTEIQKKVEEEEKNLNDRISRLAKIILEENENYIGTEVKNLAIDKLENTKERGEENVSKTKRRKKITAIQ